MMKTKGLFLRICRITVLMPMILLFLIVSSGGMKTYAENKSTADDSGEERVFDEAGLFSQEEMEALETQIRTMRKDKRWNSILDSAYDEVSSQNYGACAGSFLDGVTKYYRAGIPGGQYNYDKETGKISVYRSIRWYEAALAALIGLIAAAVACGGVTSRYSMKKERGWARSSLMAYRANSQFRYSDQFDHLVNKTVTYMIIPRNPGNVGRGGGGGFSSGGRSTTHTSSGRTMGGGGRKF